MNDFPALQERSLEEWQALQQSPDPVIYIGMGSCGLASGAGDVWKLTREILDQRKLNIKVLKVGCIGPCYLEPFLDIQKPGLPRVSFNNVNEQTLRKLIPGLFNKREIRYQADWTPRGTHENPSMGLNHCGISPC